MFSTTTRLLIRWARGLIAVGSSGPEQYVEMAGVTDYEQARQLGSDLLAAHAGSRGTVAVTGHVHDGTQQPGAAFYAGDVLGGYVVQSIAITSDGDGNTVVTPELGDPKQRRLDAVSRRIARASAGSTSEFASPFPPRAAQGDAIDSTPPLFTYTWRQPAGSPGS